MHKPQLLVSFCISWLLLTCASSLGQQINDAILFHATFDASHDATLAKGDSQIYTAESMKREKTKPGLHTDAVEWRRTGGRKGGALFFTKKSKQLVYFEANRNVPFDKAKFRGTVSFWMQLSPKEDLPEGFVDPLQITDKKWNDASFFVDFDKEKEREFRLGAFSDHAFWNPDKRNFDNIPRKERPMVFVKDWPFTRKTWTHVAFTWDAFNTGKEAAAELFLNGESRGKLTRKQQFTWDPSKAVIMLGINYVGGLDDLAIFDRALSAEEIKQIAK